MMKIKLPCNRGQWPANRLLAPSITSEVNRRCSSKARADRDAGPDANQEPHQPRPLVKPDRRSMLVGASSIITMCPCCQAKAAGKSFLPVGRVGWYDSFFAYLMATSMDEYEAAAKPIKLDLIRSMVQQTMQAGAPYRVLEMGIGTGPNIQYLVQAVRQQSDEPSTAKLPLQLVGLDPNVAMHSYAQQTAEAAGLPADQLQLVDADAGRMPWPDNSFDAVICTLVLCSVPDPAAALSEVKRVLRPGGQLMFIEHVAADWQQAPWLRARQVLLDPLQQLLADGCHLTRQTGQVLDAAGFTQVLLEKGQLQGLSSADSLIAPHVWGRSIK